MYELIVLLAIIALDVGYFALARRLKRLEQAAEERRATPELPWHG